MQPGSLGVGLPMSDSGHRKRGAGQPPVQALLRGLDVLRVLNLNGGLSASEVAKRTGIARITAFRLLKTLREAGYVVCDEPKKTYRLGPGILELNSRYAKQTWVLQIAAPFMDELCAEVGWPLVLATNNGPRMIIQHTTRDQTGFWLRMKGPGSQLPLLKSSVGLAFLAHSTKSVQADLLRSARALDGELTPTMFSDRQGLARLLDGIRSSGIASLRDSWYSESVPLSAIAVPIMRGRTVFAALGLTYYQASMFSSEAIRKFGGVLKAAAQRIGAEL